jgi:hypothetical protein
MSVVCSPPFTCEFFHRKSIQNARIKVCEFSIPRFGFVELDVVFFRCFVCFAAQGTTTLKIPQKSVNLQILVTDFLIFLLKVVVTPSQKANS